MTSRPKRNLPRLPPAWIRRCDWAWSNGEPMFFFPHLDHAAEGRELARLDDWADRNPDIMAAWMVLVDHHRAPNQCGCPACTGRGGEA